jgi:hypothetical protein
MAARRTGAPPDVMMATVDRWFVAHYGERAGRWVTKTSPWGPYFSLVMPLEVDPALPFCTDRYLAKHAWDLDLDPKKAHALQRDAEQLFNDLRRTLRSLGYELGFRPGEPPVSKLDECEVRIFPHETAHDYAKQTQVVTAWASVTEGFRRGDPPFIHVAALNARILEDVLQRAIDDELQRLVEDEGLSPTQAHDRIFVSAVERTTLGAVLESNLALGASSQMIRAVEDLMRDGYVIVRHR